VNTSAQVIVNFAVLNSTAQTMAQNNENDDATKLRKRHEAVESIKRSPAFILTNLYYKKDRVPIPDPNNLEMTKRQWEKSVMKWRNALRDGFHELCTQ